MFTKIELSQEQWRSLQREIESELNHSHIYHQALKTIATLLNISPHHQTAEKKAQILLKAVTQEAINLTLEKLANQITDHPTPANHGSSPEVAQEAMENLPETSLQEWETRLRTVGKQIQEARLKKGLSLSQLHNLCLVLPNHIYILETGHVELLPPNYPIIKDMLVKLAEPLDLDPQNLLSYLTITAEPSATSHSSTPKHQRSKNLLSLFKSLSN